MDRETEEEWDIDQRALVARLACSEGDAVACGDLIRAAALRLERRSILRQLDTLGSAEAQPAEARPDRVPHAAQPSRRTLGKTGER